MFKKIELLAPAKDLECGLAAINCGADAVYIGADKFGARENAGNSVKQIAELAEYSHKYWARVYVALNTILKDQELPVAEKLIKELYAAGIDGLIIQDLGLLELELPPLPLIASTQMHNDTLEKIQFLEKVGFQRVILPREFSLEDIKKIKANTNIELECFVHGALCVCYSGQCYLSYAQGGRSANRGACAQPCRKPYSLQDANGKTIIKNKYLLSLKDLNLSDQLSELIEAGVTSFKIEGRLKDVNYVKNIVSYYRQQLDKIIEQKPEWGLRTPRLGENVTGTVKITFIPNPSKTFNRGYTDYFINGRQPDLASFNTPKSLGEYIGKISKVDPKYFEIDSDKKLNNGDGICYFDQYDELSGLHINTVKDGQIYPDKMPKLTVGTELYRNHDQEFIQTLKAPVKSTIPVALTFSATETGFKLIIKDENANQIEETIIAKKEIAKNKDQALDTIKKQLSKLGDTEFVCVDIKLEIPEPYFIPITVLNNLRRQAVAKLQTERLKNYLRIRKAGQRPNSVSADITKYPQKKLSYLGNVLNKKAELFYKRHGVTEIESAAESGLAMSGKKLMTTKYCLKYELGCCSKHKLERELVSRDGKNFVQSINQLYLVDDSGHKLKLNFNCQDCVMELFAILK